MQNIIVTRQWPAAVQDEFCDRVTGRASIVFNDQDQPFTHQQMRDALRAADIVCPTVTDSIDASVLAGTAVRTRLLANFGVGFNHIDMHAANSVGVVVTNTPGVLTAATAEIALTLLLSCARRSNEGERLVRQARWQGWHPTHMLSTQVSGKTLGLVGMGRIGQAFARMAYQGLGMRICYHSRTRLESAEERGLRAEFTDLDTLLEQSDFVSLHCPATPETRHLINARTLEKMPQQAFLINTARGDVVDEVALVDALRSGQIAGAGLDVYAQEPALAAGLAELENVVLLPHMGSGTRETRVAMGRCAIDNVCAYLDGQPLPNPVR